MSDSKNRVISKIAIVKLSAMGDVIHAMVALQYIRKQYPNVQIDWIVESAFAAVLEHNPHINNIYKVNLKQIKKDKLSIFKQIKLIKEYSYNKYDLVIDAQGLFKSAMVSKLLKAPIAGFDKYSTREKIASSFYTDKISIAYDANTIDRNAKVMSTALGFEISRDNILNKEPFLFYQDENKTLDEYLCAEKKNILFVVGASWSSKIYSKEKFAKIANSMNENCLIVWGSAEEKEMAEFIASNSCAKVLPKLDLNALKAVISKADLVIGNDTGPTHMAWALNVPSITLFGNTPGYRNTYLTDINKVIESDTEVNPCKLDRNDFSITQIEEEKIIEAAKSLLNG